MEKAGVAKVLPPSYEAGANVPSVNIRKAAIPKNLFADILQLIAELRPLPVASKRKARRSELVGKPRIPQT
jgi:hypothetical protein